MRLGQYWYQKKDKSCYIQLESLPIRREKNHVNTILSAFFKTYGPPSHRLQISQY